MPLQVKQSFVVRTDSTANFELTVSTRQTKPVSVLSSHVVGARTTVNFSIACALAVGERAP